MSETRLKIVDSEKPPAAFVAKFGPRLQPFIRRESFRRTLVRSDIVARKLENVGFVICEGPGFIPGDRDRSQYASVERCPKQNDKPKKLCQNS